MTCAKTGYVTSGKTAKVFPGILQSNAGVERAALSPEILGLIELDLDLPTAITQASQRGMGKNEPNTKGSQDKMDSF